MHVATDDGGGMNDKDWTLYAYPERSLPYGSRYEPSFTQGAVGLEMLIRSAVLFKIKVLSLKRNSVDYGCSGA